jgi:hypothetical protein
MMSKRRYLRELYARLSCAYCGAVGGHIVLHHPNGDGDLGRISNIPARTPNLIACLDAEVGRCVPLCRSCHQKEHDQLRMAAGWRRFFPNRNLYGWRWQRPGSPLKGDEPV